MMLRYKKVDNTDLDLAGLIAKLDKELAITDGNEHEFYNQYNGLEDIQHILLVCENDTPLACGAFKEMDEHSVEIKRMYVLEDFRGQGIAGELLEQLESWARISGFHFSVLETGKRQKSAIRLYEKKGYERINNYGQYEGKENSYCFRKKLT